MVVLALFVGAAIDRLLPRVRPRKESASDGNVGLQIPVEGRGPVAVPVCTHTPTELIHAVTRLYRAEALVLIHVVEVPDDLPLEAGLPPVEEEELRAMMEDLRDTAEADLESPVSLEILRGRDPARTLLEWIHHHEPSVVVLALHKERPNLSPTALSILRDARSQVWVWRGSDETHSRIRPVPEAP